MKATLPVSSLFFPMDSFLYVMFFPLHLSSSSAVPTFTNSSSFAQRLNVKSYNYTTVVFCVVQYVQSQVINHLIRSPREFCMHVSIMGATPVSELMRFAIFSDINHHAFEKTASEHQCNILLKS